jgi:Ca2+-dependent lipid-binding protein
VIKNTLDPSWKPFEMPVAAVCNGDYDRSIKFECFDWNSDGTHDYIGEFGTSLREVSGHEAQSSTKTFELINAKKKAKKGNKYKNRFDSRS